MRTGERDIASWQGGRAAAIARHQHLKPHRRSLGPGNRQEVCPQPMGVISLRDQRFWLFHVAEKPGKICSRNIPAPLYMKKGDHRTAWLPCATA